MNPHFYDEDFAPDASRTFGPAVAPERSGFWAVIAVLLIAIGSALYLGAFR